MVLGLVWSRVSPVREYSLMHGFLSLVMVSWVAVSTLSKEIYYTRLDDGFINYKLLIHNKLFLYSTPVILHFLMWLFVFCKGHIKELLMSTTDLIFRMPCLEPFSSWCDRSNPTSLLYFGGLSWVIWGISPPILVGCSSRLLCHLPCVRRQLLRQSGGTAGAGFVCHLLIHLFSSPGVDAEGGIGWGVGLVAQSWSSRSPSVEGKGNLESVWE